MTTIIDSRQINISSNSASQQLNDNLLSNVVFDFVGLLRDEPNILYKQITVCNAQIPVSFYIINEYNNILKYSIGGSIITLNFPYGNYNATSFITKFKELLSGWGCVLDKITGKLTFTYTINFIFYSSSLYSLLGFIGTSSTSVLNSLTAVNLCDFSGVRRLSIRSNILRLLNRDSTTGNYTSDICVIPVNQPAYGIIKYENISGFKNILSNNALDQIDISIFDDDNNLVDFNGINWTITLQLDIIRKLNNQETQGDQSSLERNNNNIQQLTDNINLLIDAMNPDTIPQQDQADQQDQQQEEPQQIQGDVDTNNDLDLLMYQSGINL